MGNEDKINVMKKNNKYESLDLRQKAEERLKLRTDVAGTDVAGTDVARNVSTAADTLKLIHELEVHQVELEMQNEELILANEKAALASKKYIELYDSAPTGYFILSPKGEIMGLNPAGAAILGKARSQLINLLFHVFVSDNSKLFFFHFLEKVFSRHEKETCELTLLTNSEIPVSVYITGIISENGANCLLTMINITERKLLESSVIDRLLLQRETEKAGKIGGWSFNVKTLIQNWTIETFNILEIDTTKGTPDVHEGIEFIDEPFRHSAKIAIKRAVEFGEPFEQEWKVTTAKGNKRWVNVVGKTKIVRGKTIGLFGSFQDITKHKIAEIQIEKLTRVYTVLSSINKTIIRVRDKQLLFEEVCCIAVKNGGFKMAWVGMVNPATNKIDVVASFGKTGKYLNDININLNNETLNSGPAGLAIKSGKFNFSNNIETDDRTFYWREKAREYGFRSIIALPIIVFGKTIGVYMIYSGEIDFFNEAEFKLLEEMASDISYALEFIESEKERRQAEESLMKLKTAIDKSEISVVITDNNGNIEYANPFFTKLTGYSPKEYIGKTPRILKSEYHTIEFYEEMWNTIKSGITWEGEFYNRKKDGEMYWENAIITPIANSKNEITHFVAIKTDITDAKNINSELIIAKEHAVESDRLKSAFLANMSHEIRTPMNGILGFTELLKEPELPNDQQKYFISIIEKSGKRLLNIINDIIDISKIESGQMKVKNSAINVNEYLDQILTFFTPEAEAKNIKLICKPGLPNKEAFVTTDSEKFYAILTNLVKNALKYTETGFIEFGYNRQPNHSHLQFYVKDTGIGIPKDRQEAIFERFVQADILDKMARQGAGLGLSISKAYIEMLGGKISLESEEENLSDGKSGGSTFYFTLPIPASHESENTVKIINPAKKVQDNPEVLGLKIIIAEDDETSGEFISIGARKFGKQVIKVQNGREAVEACRNNPDTDLILMDIQMPELSGYEATRQIRQFNTKVIIIALTAYALAGDREKTIEAGCNDYISKPIKMADLVGMIQKYFKG